MSTAQPPPNVTYPPGPYGQPPPPTEKPWWKKKRFVIPGLLGLVLAVGIANSPDDPTTAVPAPAPTVAATSASASPTPSQATRAEPTAAPKPEPTRTTQAPKAKPKPPSLTTAQENAVESAQSYLESAGFSKKGLIEQLEYEEYSTKDAAFAVAYLEKKDLVDWNAEAAESAESYLDSGSFSRKGLIEQLRYEGFTQKQAEYGVEQAGL